MEENIIVIYQANYEDKDIMKKLDNLGDGLSTAVNSSKSFYLFTGIFM